MPGSFVLHHLHQPVQLREHHFFVCIREVEVAGFRKAMQRYMGIVFEIFGRAHRYQLVYAAKKSRTGNLDVAGVFPAAANQNARGSCKCRGSAVRLCVHRGFLLCKGYVQAYLLNKKGQYPEALTFLLILLQGFF